MISGIITIIILGITFSSAFAGYNSIIRKWTEGGRVYSFDTMDANLIWKATLLSDEVLDSQLALLKKKKLDIKLDSHSGTSFFVSLYAKKELKDFSLDDSSTWKIYLIGADGAEIPPTRIESVTITPTETVFYPYLNRWSRAYIVEFPAISLNEAPKLVLRSIVAESVLKWSM